MGKDDRSSLSRRAVIGGTLGLVSAAACSEAKPPPAGASPRDTSTKASQDHPMRMPTLYLPHGAGPCFFMDWTMGPADTWDRTAAWLRGIPGTLPERPKAVLVISAHWEEAVPTVTTAASPSLLFDYYGFPEHTYQLAWPAPGAPALAERIRGQLGEAGFETSADAERGLDHGVFIPLKLALPDADVPTVQLSLKRGLNPAEHLAMGRALAPLRDDGVFIVGSGMSYHNMRGFGRSGSLAQSRTFDGWLASTCEGRAASRSERLGAWTEAPEARTCHPREEHLLPLMVVAGAAEDDPGQVDFRDDVMGVTVSALRFG